MECRLFSLIFDLTRFNFSSAFDAKNRQICVNCSLFLNLVLKIVLFDEPLNFPNKSSGKITAFFFIKVGLNDLNKLIMAKD
uniref:Uncharacterized protein n=1 Tax=Romanomermis culicivorax TaxID=13658 RepID=A0A915IT10_ROMCU